MYLLLFPSASHVMASSEAQSGLTVEIIKSMGCDRSDEMTGRKSVILSAYIDDKRKEKK